METHEYLMELHFRNVASLRRSGINGNWWHFDHHLTVYLHFESLLFGEVELMETQYLISCFDLKTVAACRFSSEKWN